MNMYNLVLLVEPCIII